MIEIKSESVLSEDIYTKRKRTIGVYHINLKVYSRGGSYCDVLCSDLRVRKILGQGKPNRDPDLSLTGRLLY